MPHENKRAVLGESFKVHHRLAGEHTRYYEANTVMALTLTTICGIVYGVVTNSLLVEFITVYASLI